MQTPSETVKGGRGAVPPVEEPAMPPVPPPGVAPAEAPATLAPAVPPLIAPLELGASSPQPAGGGSAGVELPRNVRCTRPHRLRSHPRCEENADDARFAQVTLLLTETGACQARSPGERGCRGTTRGR
jgi:hypothetical protein